MQTPVSTIVQTGDLGGRKIGMEIDSSAMAHIMSVLTDLYSDPEGAVIREYSTNALDAHIQAGNTAPIQVFTPNALSPYFKVKDFGVGLSVDDIVDMYSKYGASTKRDTNDQVGMLGLGAKSALTLVPQFSLTSVKDGVRIVVSISRAADGSGQMEIIDTKGTDEPNGVEISIPVPRNHNFITKCEHFFRFWKPGTVLIDGKEPEHVSGRPVGEKFIVNNELRQDYVVMGNVAYPLKDSLYTDYNYYRQLGIVAFVNIGDVNFTPSREQLHYTAKTKETVQNLQKEFSKSLVQAANDDVAAAPTHAEAWRRAQAWTSSFHSLRDFSYRGSKIPTDIPFVADTSSNVYGVTTIQGKSIDLVGRTARYATWVRYVNPSMVDNNIFITGFAESLKMSPTQREKVAVYATQQGWSITKVALFKQDEIIDNPTHLAYLEGIKIVKWEDIAKIKVARAKTARAVKTDPYDLYTGKYSYTPTSTLDTTRQIIYISPAEEKRPSHLCDVFPDAQIVMLGQNRWDKFKRDYPTAVHHVTALRNAQKVFISQLTKSDRILLTFDTYTKRSFEFLVGLTLDDPDLAEYVEIISGKVELSPAAKSLKAMPRGWNSTDIEDVANPLTKYPLASNLRYVDRDHAAWYINSYYSQIKEN